jgi:hypothetical protein
MGIVKLIFRVEAALRLQIDKVLDRLRNLEAIVERQSGDIERLQQEYFAIVEAVRRIERSLESRIAYERESDRKLEPIRIRLDRVEKRLELVEATKGETK